ncbi:DNA methyltransferase [Hymenobacter sp. BT730]|uniref:Eco57I restriction-modification methylase domain-containing protein n=1 Tax=Hymenobacter sp. BT730 TaxID=3063332 RepID=UPI0026E0AEF8|nr:DNA methyltransferase [Hymenobacter sp. BT730]
MPELLPLFPATTLPARFTHFTPATTLPDFAERVRALRRWQQAIRDGYVRAHKEEALQAEFLNLLFGEVLGYEFRATTHRQLQLELKTLTDGTKPDGALGEFVATPSGGLGGPVRAIVELKDARTSLDAKQRGGGGKGRAETPVEQAFSYPSKFGGQCRWVLVSNFLELRLYHAQDQTRAEVFQLETLPDQPEQLHRFFALLLPQHLLPAAGQAEAPLDEALHQRQQQELKITKAFYQDYSRSRRQLLDHLIEQNPAVPPLELLAHTQKLLDRVIFVCFCEDKNIIPRLTFRRLLDAVRANVFDPAGDKVYRTVRGLFQSIDQGNPAAHINRFNGGLFAPDAALDALHIQDRTLTPVIQLEQYDFASDLNVNILGHIFEQSLSDLEQERARLSGQTYDQKQGKRKQDGIFYTPEYITRYIVQQAVGGWLQARRQEAGLEQLPELDEKDRQSIRVDSKGRLVAPSARVQKHLAAWEQYRQALENIRVLDPACGSGAFLIEAFGYLLREGQQVNQELAALRGGQTTVFDLDRHILQHNLYGVDLNPESIDITRLSLWLQTANPGKPLTSLDHSIRCGNSLISEPAVAGPRAFDWPTAFPEVFAQGGFDVVIGNPPYVRADAPGNDKSFREYMVKSGGYETLAGKWDLYVPFIEKGLQLLAAGGLSAMIIPDAFVHATYAQKTLQWLKQRQHLRFIDYYPDMEVFEGVGVKSITVHLSKTPQAGFEQRIHQNEQEHHVIPFVDYPEHLRLDATKSLSGHTDTPYYSLSTICYSSVGIVGNSDEKLHAGAYVLAELVQETPDTEHSKGYFEGKDIGRWNVNRLRWIEYGTERSPGWWRRKGFPEFFAGSKLATMLSPGQTPRTCLDETGAYFNHSAIGFKRWIDLQGVENNSLRNACSDTKRRSEYEEISSRFSLPFLLAILNSKPVRYELNTNRRSNIHIYPEDWKSIRIPKAAASPAIQQPIIAAAESLLIGHKTLQEAEARVARLVQAELGLSVPLIGKLALTQPWKTWSAALEKALGRKLSLAEKSTWLEYLDDFQQQHQQRRAALDAQDAALDQLVYQLYQLTPEEIALVEGR